MRRPGWNPSAKLPELPPYARHWLSSSSFSSADKDATKDRARHIAAKAIADKIEHLVLVVTYGARPAIVNGSQDKVPCVPYLRCIIQVVRIWSPTASPTEKYQETRQRLYSARERPAEVSPDLGGNRPLTYPTRRVALDPSTGRWVRFRPEYLHKTVGDYPGTIQQCLRAVV